MNPPWPKPAASAPISTKLPVNASLRHPASTAQLRESRRYNHPGTARARLRAYPK
jgi:hypothetical protein